MTTRRRGDDWRVEGQITDGGTAVDLTGATVTAQIRSRPDGPVVATWTVEVIDAAEGRVALTLSHTVTEGIKPNPYVYDIRVDGDTVQTYGDGPDPAPLRVRPAVTEGA